VNVSIEDGGVPPIEDGLSEVRGFIREMHATVRAPLEACTVLSSAVRTVPVTLHGKRLLRRPR
jgi:hypothetical protein